MAHRLAIATVVGDGRARARCLLDGLRGLNYIEGRNLKLEALWADGDQAVLPRLAHELVQRKVDVICTAGTPATLAAKQATTTIPIVFGRAAFPVRPASSRASRGPAAT